MECGFTGVSPRVIKAGMDPGALRAQYPTLGCGGGIDKVAVATGGPKGERALPTVFCDAAGAPCLRRGHETRFTLCSKFRGSPDTRTRDPEGEE